MVLGSRSFMRVAVVYLRREPKGADLFVEAMAKFDAGMPHDVVVINKGDQAQFCRGVKCVSDINVSDFGLSLRAFAAALPQLQGYDAICFCNSWTRPAQDGWLRRMAGRVEHSRAGLVGSMDCSVSFASNTRNPLLRRLKLLLFEPFPNWHIRTTGFIAKTEVLNRVWPRWPYGTKWMEYLHESGRWSVTRRSQKLFLFNFVEPGTMTDAR